MNYGKFNDYCNLFVNWLALGIIEKRLTLKRRGVHYLPYRVVINENKTSDIKPVFNDSYHVPGFPSLNDCLLTEPNLTEMISSI